jgi:3-hydroxybutyryl-CoA dehydrogenase
MQLGFNWPLGPLEWGNRIGWARALGRLEHLRELHGEAYRPAPLLREAATTGSAPTGSS